MMARAAVTALLVGLAVPASAGAAGSAALDRLPGPYHGGGLPEGGPVLAFVNLGEDGRSFEAAITLRAECEDFAVPVQARVNVLDGRLDRDAEATVTRAIEGEAAGPDGRPARETGESTVTLKVDDGGRASGTVRIASELTDAETGEPVAECDSGEVAFRVRQVPGGLPRRAARPPARAATLLGVAGAQPLVARTSAGGDLDGLAFVYRSGCQPRSDGRGARRVVFLPEFAVRKDGSFRVRATQQLLLPGGEERVRIELKGRYVAFGSLRARLRLRGELTRDGEDEASETCDSGVLKVRALPGNVTVRRAG